MVVAHSLHSADDPSWGEILLPPSGAGQEHGLSKVPPTFLLLADAPGQTEAPEPSWADILLHPNVERTLGKEEEEQAASELRRRRRCEFVAKVAAEKAALRAEARRAGLVAIAAVRLQARMRGRKARAAAHHEGKLRGGATLSHRAGKSHASEAQMMLWLIGLIMVVVLGVVLQPSATPQLTPPPPPPPPTALQLVRSALDQLKTGVLSRRLAV